MGDILTASWEGLVAMSTRCAEDGPHGFAKTASPLAVMRQPQDAVKTTPKRSEDRSVTLPIFALCLGCDLSPS